MTVRKLQRPVFFNLTQIQMPAGALTSITHRVTGMILVFAIPACVYFLNLSLEGPVGFARASALLNTAPLKAIGVVLAWALAHHMLAGTRHLLSDIDIGSQLTAARRSAWIVNLGGVGVALLAAGILL